MEIELRPIRYADNKDKENYFALQKSVAILQNIYQENTEYNDYSWQEFAKDNNRICFVIETLREHSYCGECAVKDISADIPEVEIELMKEQWHKGIGYQSLVNMLNRIAAEYKKEKFYAKIEPDNYASQLLFEKIGGIPADVERDYKISDGRMSRFIETHQDLLDEKIYGIAEKFGVEANLLLTHVLVYLVDINKMNLLKNRFKERSENRERLEVTRSITREKMIDIMKETLEDLEDLMELSERNEKSAFHKKLGEMENKILNRIEKIDPKNNFIAK